MKPHNLNSIVISRIFYITQIMDRMYNNTKHVKHIGKDRL